MNKQEYRRQFDLEKSIDTMQRLVEQENFRRKIAADALTIRGVRHHVEKHRVLVAVEMVEGRLGTVKKVLVVHAHKTMLHPLGHCRENSSDGAGRHFAPVGEHRVELARKIGRQPLLVEGKADAPAQL